MIEDRQLGDSAMTYLRGTLARGDRLAHHLLDLPLERGRVHAYLPTEIEVGKIADFGNDIFWGKDLDPDDDWNRSARRFVRAYLTAASMNLAVWEGWPEKIDREPNWSGDLNHFWDNDGIWAVWDGPNGSRAESRTAYIYMLNTSDDECIVSAFRHARVYPSVCVLTELEEGVHFPPAPFVVSDPILVDLAASANHVLAGAFDERGWVI